MTFNEGDRVVTTGTGDHFDHMPGTVTASSDADAGYYIVTLDGDSIGREFAGGELKLVEAATRFVNVVSTPSIWVTLPGDNESHRLSVEDAKQLLRELEAAV